MAYYWVKSSPTSVKSVMEAFVCSLRSSNTRGIVSVLQTLIILVLVESENLNLASAEDVAVGTFGQGYKSKSTFDESTYASRTVATSALTTFYDVTSDIKTNKNITDNIFLDSVADERTLTSFYDLTLNESDFKSSVHVHELDLHRFKRSAPERHNITVGIFAERSYIMDFPFVINRTIGIIQIAQNYTREFLQDVADLVCIYVTLCFTCCIVFLRLAVDVVGRTVWCKQVLFHLETPKCVK